MKKFSLSQTQKRGKTVWVASIFTGVTGKRHRLFRDTADEAERAANQYITENQLYGSELSSLTTQERAFVLRLRERGISLDSADAVLKDAGKEEIPLATAITDYLKTQSGNSYGHLKSLRSQLQAFACAFSGRSVASIRAADVSTYLLAHKKGERAIYRRLRAFFNWCVMMDKVPVNPISKVPKPGADTQERIIFTAEQMRSLLAAAADDPVMLRFLVLGGFYGLRTAEIVRLQGQDIDKGEIHVRRMKTSKKGIRERWVVPTPNARMWLESLDLPKDGPVITVNDANFRIHRQKMLAKAKGIPAWPYNVLRRSYGSYHLAAFENPNLTALRMGHTSPETTIAKYQAVRKKAAGEAWFAIFPGLSEWIASALSNHHGCSTSGPKSQSICPPATGPSQ